MVESVDNAGFGNFYPYIDFLVGAGTITFHSPFYRRYRQALRVR